MQRSGFSSRKKRLSAGALLVDVMIGMFMLMIATLTLMSLFPVIKRGEEMSTDETKAVQMMSRMIEHIQMLSTDDLNGETLASLNLIDNSQAFQPYSFTNIPLDEASIYSPGQVLQDADATMTITDLPDGSKRVDLSMSYASDSGETQTMRTGTIVGVFR